MSSVKPILAGLLAVSLVLPARTSLAAPPAEPATETEAETEPDDRGGGGGGDG